MIYQAGADIDNVPSALGDHRPDHRLGDEKEPFQVHRGHCRVVVERVVRERPSNVDPGVIDQGVDASVALEGQLDDACGCLWVGDVAFDAQKVR